MSFRSPADSIPVSSAPNVALLDAVQKHLLDRVGPARFAARLEHAGLSLRFPRGVKPNLSLILGGTGARLEELVETFNADLPMLKEFILPGGTRPAAVAHLCRTVARRAERAMVRLNTEEPLSDAARRYINRLSDLLFILGRLLNRAGGRGDVLWQKGKNAA